MLWIREMFFFWICILKKRTTPRKPELALAGGADKNNGLRHMLLDNCQLDAYNRGGQKMRSRRLTTFACPQLCQACWTIDTLTIQWAAISNNAATTMIFCMLLILRWLPIDPRSFWNLVNRKYPKDRWTIIKHQSVSRLFETICLYQSWYVAISFPLGDYGGAQFNRKIRIDRVRIK